MKILIFFSALILFDTVINGAILKNISIEITLLLSYCFIPIDLKIFKYLIKFLPYSYVITALGNRPKF